MENDKPHIIIDNGSGYTKAGFAGEEGPSAVFKAVVGRPKLEKAMLGTDEQEVFVGTAACEKKGILSLKYPIDEGIVTNWDDMELIWNHCFTNELRCKPSEHNVLLTEAPLNPKNNREKMCEIMFDTFNVKGLYIGIQAVLSLYSAGKFSGIVVDSGDGVTHTVPIYEGYSITHAIGRINLAGRHLTEYFIKLLTEINQDLTSSSEIEIAKDMKEKVCYVALNYAEELSTFEKTNKNMVYEMPDGKSVTVGNQRFRAPELMFKPSLMGKEYGGVHELTFKSIQKSDVDIRKELYSNIIISGGSTLYPGFPERLTQEMKLLAPVAISGKVKVIASAERKYAVWIGGSVLTSIPTFSSSWITKEEYDEYGADIVNKKCF